MTSPHPAVAVGFMGGTGAATVFSASTLRLIVLLGMGALLLLATRATQASAEPPVLAWWHAYDGAARGIDEAVALRVDRCGRVWVTGTSQGAGTGKDIATLYYEAGIPFSVNRYNGPENLDDSPVALELDREGNVYVLGHSAAAGRRDLVLLKYDRQGQPVWTVRRTDAQRPFQTAGDLKIDSAGDIYVYAATSGTAGSDVALLKYDPEGAFLWEEHYQAPDRLVERTVGLVLDAQDEGPYVSVWSTSLAGNYDFVTLRYGVNGGLAWERTFNGGPNIQDVPRKIVAAPTGGVVVTGTSRTEGFRSFWVTFRYDREGNQLWRRDYSAPPNADTFPSDLTVDRNGDVTIAGSTGDNGTYTYTLNHYDLLGNLQWTRSHPAPDPAPAFFVPHLEADPLGRPYLAMPVDGSRHQEIRVVAYDLAGEERWQRQFGDSKYSGVRLRDLAVDGAGSVYFAGGGAGLPNSEDFLTVKYDAAFPRPEVELYDASFPAADPVRLPAASVDYSLLGSELWPHLGRSVSRIAADGVTLLLVRVPLPEGVAGDVHMSVGAAGADDPGSLWNLEDLGLYDLSESGGQRDGQGRGPQELHVPVRVIEGKLWAFALYRAPRDFARNTNLQHHETRDVTLRVCVPGRLGEGFDSLLYKEITVVRPLVLLVHGTFSSPDTWWSFPLFRQSGNDLNRYQVAGGKPFNVGRLSFASVDGAAGGAVKTARELLPQFTRTIRQWARLREVAATQADVVTHSYGGVVTRVAAQLQSQPIASANEETGFRTLENWGHGPIHKLITIGATHRGAAIVNHCAAANRRSSGKIGVFAGWGALRFDRGAMRDQFVTTGAAGLLRTATPFPGHAIVGSGLVEYAESPEYTFFQLLHWYDDEDGPYRGAGESFRSGNDNFAGIRRLTNYVFNMDYNVDQAPGELAPNYDLTLGSRSAIGGLPAGAYSERTQIGVLAGRLTHLQQTGDLQVSNRVEFLLNQATTSSFFAPFPAFDPTLSTAERRLAELAEPGDLNIRPFGSAGKDGPTLSTDAAEGLVAVGQSVRVSVSWPGKTIDGMLLLWPTRGGTASARIGGKAPALDLVVEAIPSGRFALAASVRAEDGEVREALLELTLQDSTPYTALTVVPERLTLDSGYPAPLAVYGQLPGGEWREVTRSSATQVVSQNPGIAAVSSDVSVRPVSAGNTAVTVTVAGAGSVQVPVSVTAAPPEAPSAPTGLAATVLSPTAVSLAWTDTSTTKDSFEIERRANDGSFLLVAVTGANTTTFNDTGLSELTRYEYRVRATNAGGDSAYAGPSVAETGATPGGKLVVAKKLSFGKVRVGTVREKKLLLRNVDRRASLTVKLGPVSGAGFTLSGGGTQVIPPRGRLQVPVQYSATEKGRATGTLSVRSSDPRKTRVEVQLLATAR